MLKNPFIVTTPRTGSTVICYLLGEIAKHKWGYKHTLFEYFNISPADKNWRYDVDVDGIVQWRPRQPGDSPFWETQDERASLILNRMKSMTGANRYMVKAFPDHLTTNCVVFDELQKRYQFVFLERRDKIAQFLSVCSKRATGKPHYAVTDIEVADKLEFAIPALDSFVKQIQEYKVMKAMFPESPVLVYEDFMAAGGDQQALISLLQLQECDTIPIIPMVTKPTPYVVDDLERLFINPQEWKRHETRVKEILHKL